MSIISWIILGLICGAISRAILGTKSGFLGNLVLGVIGALVGGWLGSMIFDIGLGTFWSLRTWVLGILGSIIVLAIYNWIRGNQKN